MICVFVVCHYLQGEIMHALQYAMLEKAMGMLMNSLYGRWLVMLFDT